MILNLGCGTKTCSHQDVVNIDWSIYLRLRENLLLRRVAPLLLRGYRRRRFLEQPTNLLVHDLRKGIPFDSNSVDAVYHSHLLEHLDRDVVVGFLLEVRRVLKPSGVQRIVVPDLECLCREYLEHVSLCDRKPAEAVHHETYVEDLLEQSVRREAHGTSQQAPLRRCVENRVLGDARKRGETHQWMYDRISLREVLVSAGFGETHVQKFNTSLIPHWNKYQLDLNESGDEYKPKSLYMEARKMPDT